jgi:hypothetical protein
LIILDENILDSQRLLLQTARIPARQIGVDIGRKGLKDDEIIVLLRRQHNATFFTRDAGFYQANLRHRAYGLVVLAVGQNEAAAFIRRFLRHTNFDTQAKRTGRVIRLSHAGLTFWRLRSQSEIRSLWNLPK